MGICLLLIPEKKAKPMIKDTISEMDEEYHDKFRKPENKKST
jgi:hypothetical protein